MKKNTEIENSNITDINTEIHSIKEFSINLKNFLEEKYPYIWLRGEIGSIKLHSSGHTYFSLKEEEYVINAISWKGTALSTTLIEGSIIECYGKITIYSGRSSYQIIVKEAREVSKQGNIFFQLEQLKKKLLAEGLFDSSRKKSITTFPEQIAILTSPTGAVLHDIMHRIKDRFPCCIVYFFPITVQGSQSVQSIIKALQQVNILKDKIDTVILARGGGSLEDLWIFNDEQIVREIAKMEIPIITAIGHETDTTLVDYVADLRAPTPTAAAEIAVPDKIQIKETINFKLSNAVASSSEIIKKYKILLNILNDTKYIYQNAIGAIEQKIDNFVLTFINSINYLISNKKIEIKVFEKPTERLEILKQKIEEYCKIMSIIIKLRLEEATNICINQEEFITDKTNELKEKIIITDKKNKRIISALSLQKEKEFVVKLIDGSVNAFVQDYDKKKLEKTNE